MKRKASVVVGLLIVSSVSLFILSHKAFLSSSHHAASRIQTLHEKGTVLKAIWEKSHLTRLLDAHVKYISKKIVEGNASSENVVGNVSRVALRKPNSTYLSVEMQDSGGGGRKPGSPVKPLGEVDVQCRLAPESCLLEHNLQGEEENRLTSCLAEALSYVKQQSLLTGNSISLTKCSCHLRAKRPDNRRVALISLPGSGNTWVRGLLEHATSVCTGAMWCDPNLRAIQFCGEGLHGSRALVIKNHDRTIRWRGERLPKRPDLSENNKPEFDAVIFVHRDPYDAMVAERNREVGYALWEAAVQKNQHINLTVGHHLQSFGAEYFGDNVQWNRRVKEMARAWETMVTHLLINNKNMERILVVKYEDLVKNSEHEVLRMLKFLGHFVTQDSLKEQMKIGFSSFKRNHSLTFEHFTTAQKQLINTVINNVSPKLKSQLLPLKTYLRT